jgi:hypothetical protein
MWNQLIRRIRSNARNTARDYWPQRAQVPRREGNNMGGPYEGLSGGYGAAEGGRRERQGPQVSRAKMTDVLKHDADLQILREPRKHLADQAD